MTEQDQSSSSSSLSSTRKSSANKTLPVWAKTLVLFCIRTSLSSTNSVIENMITPLKMACMKVVLNLRTDGEVRKAQSDSSKFPCVAIDYYSDPWWNDADLENYVQQKKRITDSKLIEKEPSILIYVLVHDNYVRGTLNPIPPKVGVWVQGKSPNEDKESDEYKKRLETAAATANVLLSKFSNIFPSIEFEKDNIFEFIPCTHSLIIHVHHKLLPAIQVEIPRIVKEIYQSHPPARVSS